MSFAEYFSDGRRHNIPAAVDGTGRVVMAGFDGNEGVQKVAMMVWNPSQLAWERATTGVSSGGSGSSVSDPTTKRIDRASSAVLYVGTAPVGTVESSALWGIQKITFDVGGNATASYYATGAWSDRAALGYA